MCNRDAAVPSATKTLVRLSRSHPRTCRYSIMCFFQTANATLRPMTAPRTLASILAPILAQYFLRPSILSLGQLPIHRSTWLSPGLMKVSDWLSSHRNESQNLTFLAGTDASGYEVRVEASSNSNLMSASNLRLGTLTTNQSVSYDRIILNSFEMFSVLMKGNTQLTLSNICFDKDKSYLIIKVMYTYIHRCHLWWIKYHLSGLEESIWRFKGIGGNGAPQKWLL